MRRRHLGLGMDQANSSNYAFLMICLYWSVMLNRTDCLVVKSDVSCPWSGSDFWFPTGERFDWLDKSLSSVQMNQLDGCKGWVPDGTLYSEEVCGPWLKLVHYMGNRLLFGMNTWSVLTHFLLSNQATHAFLPAYLLTVSATLIWVDLWKWGLTANTH